MLKVKIKKLQKIFLEKKKMMKAIIKIKNLMMK
jgi:hypothetical protein